MLSDFSYKINQTIYSIYSTKDHKELRATLIDALKAYMSFEIAMFDLKSIYRGKEIYYDPYTINIPKEYVDLYYEKYLDLDYSMWVLNQPDEYLVYRDTDLISDRSRKKTPLYKNWLEPLGIDYAAGGIIAYENIVYGTVTLGKSANDTDFSDEEMEILRILIQHVSLHFHNMYPIGIIYKKSTYEETDFQSTYGLTNQENQICQLLYLDHSPKQISDKLYISINTVNRHIANIYKKVNVTSRYQLLHHIELYVKQSKKLG